MTSVTVSLEDLETLVITTGALKTIEGALAQRKRDPFVSQHLDFTAAHDRLATSMRNARRAEAGTATEWDDPLTKVEERYLRQIGDVCDGTTRTVGWALFTISAGDKMDEPVFDKLAAKGCIKIGQRIEGVMWPGADRPDIKVDPERGYAAQITPRGREKLAKINAKKEST